MRKSNADQDTVYLVAADRQDAEMYAMGAGLTGNGYYKGNGPRPWVYLKDALDIRGRQFYADSSDVVFIPGWWERADASEILQYVQLSSRLERA